MRELRSQVSHSQSLLRSVFIAPHYSSPVCSVFNFWFFLVCFLNFALLLNPSFTYSLYLKAFDLALYLRMKLWCKAGLCVKSLPPHTFAPFVYTRAWNVPDDPLSHIKDLWKVEKMPRLAASWSAPPDRGCSSSKPPYHPVCGWCVPRRLPFPGAGTEAAVVWVDVVLGRRCCSSLASSIPAVFWERWGIPIDQRALGGGLAQMTLQVLPAELFMSAFHSGRQAPIPGRFLIGMAVQTVRVISQFSFPPDYSSRLLLFK